MKQKLCVAILAALMVLGVSCSQRNTATVLILQPAPSYNSPLTNGSLQTYDWKVSKLAENGEGWGISPAKIKIGGVSPGDILTFADHDEFCLYVENFSPDERACVLSLQFPSFNTTDVDTGLIYEPYNYASQMVFTPVEFNIPAYSRVQIPVTIGVPKVDNIPNHWEFDLKVADRASVISVAYLQRWLITMR